MTKVAAQVEGGENQAPHLRLVDIGANLLDSMYSGEYNGKPYHAPDLDAVLERGWRAGIEKIIITAGSLSEAKAALTLSQRDPRLYCTVGVHPTRCGEFDAYPEGPEAYLNELHQIITQGKALGKVVAIGECGLDYDRLHFCDKEMQLKYFERQFELVEASGLPMFLHLRAAASDFLTVVSRNLHRMSPRGGVVHSFDGTQEELDLMLRAGEGRQLLAIGINGCSLKTEANLSVAASVPVERLMIETDCPWCEIKNTHAGKYHVRTLLEARDKKKHDPGLSVKGRIEPCNLVQVLEVVAGTRQEKDLIAFSEQIRKNSHQMFFPEGEDSQG